MPPGRPLQPRRPRAAVGLRRRGEWSERASERASEAAQIVLWLGQWLEDVILKEVHTGIPFGQSLLFGKVEGSLVE